MRTNILVGPAGWSHPDWNRIVYPRRRPEGFHEAAFLAHYGPLVEINTSFHALIRPEVARVWAKKVEGFRDFRFNAKLYRGLTHGATFQNREVVGFRRGLDPLLEAGRLGCVLMQFPSSFRFTQASLDRVQRIRRLLPHLDLAAEFRHESWNRNEALRALGDLRISFCNIDQPQKAHAMPPTAHVTSPVGYVRLHGRNYGGVQPAGRAGLGLVENANDYLYSTSQLTRWTKRIQQIASATRTMYVVTNNTYRGQALVNALQLRHLLFGERLEAPAELLEHYPELRSLTRMTPAQGSLFVPAVGASGRWRSGYGSLAAAASA